VIAKRAESGGSSPTGTDGRQYGCGNVAGGAAARCSMAPRIMSWLGTTGSPPRSANGGTRDWPAGVNRSQIQGALSRRRKVRHTPGAVRDPCMKQQTVQRATPSNKGMKLTSAEHIERSQLIPGVLLLLGWTTKGKPSRVWTRRAGSGMDSQAAPPPRSRGLSRRLPEQRGLRVRRVAFFRLGPAAERH